MLHQLLERLKLGPGGDVVASTVQFANLIVFDVVSLDVIPVLDGERVGPWNRDNTMIKKEIRAKSMVSFNKSI